MKSDFMAEKLGEFKHHLVIALPVSMIYVLHVLFRLINNHQILFLTRMNLRGADMRKPRADPGPETTFFKFGDDCFRLCAASLPQSIEHTTVLQTPNRPPLWTRDRGPHRGRVSGTKDTLPKVCPGCAINNGFRYSHICLRIRLWAAVGISGGRLFQALLAWKYAG